MSQKVIVRFNSFEDRERWLRGRRPGGLHIYKRNPWIAAELPDDELRLLEEQSDAQVFPDAAMSPAGAVSTEAKT